MSRSRRQSGLSWFRKPFLTAVLLLVSAPAWGYIVFFKDGSQINTKEKPRIEGDKAILILPSGTQAFYDASEIDVKKTEAINVIDYGTARLIEGSGAPKQLAKGARSEVEDTAFEDFVTGRNLALPALRRRQAVAAEGGLPVTDAGFTDLMKIKRKPYGNTDVTTEVLGYLKGQGVDRVRIFQGTEPDRPLLEVVAASEASVFKALGDAANGLVQIHQRFPKEVSAFELVMMTDSQERAGQFLLTPELADLLVSGRLKPPTFFLRYVEF